MDDLNNFSKIIYNILQLICYKIYLYSQYLKYDYPEIYNILYYIIIIYIIYKVIQFTIKWIYTTIKSIIKGLIILYIIYIIINIILLFDENSNSNSNFDFEDQIVLITNQLIQQFQYSYKFFKLLLTAFYNMFMQYNHLNNINFNYNEYFDFLNI